MRFTKNIILEIIRPYRGTQHFDERADNGYRWVSLLPEDAGDMDTDLLYVCLLSDAVRRNAEVPGYTYICIRDRVTEEDEEQELLRGMAVLNENKDCAWLLGILQRSFLDLTDWERMMDTSLIAGCDYQRLMDLCEPILENFIAVLDSSYKLLAYTKNVENTDPMNIALVEKGYHSEETLLKFKKLKRFGLYEKETGVIFSAPGELSRFECVSKWCRYGGEQLLHVVMVCSKTPLSSASVEKFNILVNYIGIVLNHEQRVNPSSVYNSLLHEMLYGELTNPFIIGERAKTSDLPFSGKFDAYRIVFEENATVLLGRFAEELATYLPESKIVAHNFEISVLNIYSENSVREGSANNIRRIMPLLKKHSALCGVSEAFSLLADYKTACTQAMRAQSLGAQLKKLGNFHSFDKDVFEAVPMHEHEGVFRYDDIYIYLMIHRAQSGPYDVFRNIVSNDTIEKLIKYDKEYSTHLTQVLYAYLVTERRATSAGRLLHMHRNSVLYHIARIEEIAGIDLNDYWTRLKLQIAFHYLELQTSNRSYISPGDENPI